MNREERRRDIQQGCNHFTDRCHISPCICLKRLRFQEKEEANNPKPETMAEYVQKAKEIPAIQRPPKSVPN